ncbi:MAG: leucine-rich repeat domain-containing protein, partial [Synergistaceae bacterium]|nr:leucine-rich repeat domain-containing protein [Synergistaceae bacterium]
MRPSFRFFVFLLALLPSVLIFPSNLLAATITVSSLNSGGSISLSNNGEVVTVTGTDQINALGWNTLKALSGYSFSLVLSNGQTSIPNYAMDVNTYITSFTADSVTSIGNNAFRNCTSLTLTSLPSGLTSIGLGAFEFCTSLALTSLPSGLTSIGNSAFQSCTNLALTSLPSGLTSIGNSAFSFCQGLTLTSLPGGLTSIGDYAFQSCTNLALTSLPSGLTSIGDGTFFECTS